MRIEVLADLHGPYRCPQIDIDAVICLGDVPNAVLEQAQDSVYAWQTTDPGDIRSSFPK